MHITVVCSRQFFIYFFTRDKDKVWKHSRGEKNKSIKEAEISISLLTITSQNRMHCGNSLHLCRSVDGILWNVTLLNSWSQHTTALLFLHADFFLDWRNCLGCFRYHFPPPTQKVRRLTISPLSVTFLVYLKETDEWEFCCVSVLRWLSVPKVRLTVIPVEWSLIKKTNRGLEIRPRRVGRCIEVREEVNWTTRTLE